MNNGKLNIVAPDGAEVALVNGVLKRAHHPERVNHLRLSLEKDFSKWTEEWLTDNARAKGESSFPNDTAIDAHYDEKWRDRCRTAEKSQDPVVENPEAMATWIKAQRKSVAKQEQYNRLLKDVHDLTPWSFKLVGVMELGNVWLSDRVALSIDDDGLVLIRLRPATMPVHIWAGAEWLDVISWVDAVELPDLKLGELFNLLTSLRYTKMTALPEPLMAFARGPQEITAHLATATPVHEPGHDGDADTPVDTTVR